MLLFVEDIFYYLHFFSLYTATVQFGLLVMFHFMEEIFKGYRKKMEMEKNLNIYPLNKK